MTDNELEELLKDCPTLYHMAEFGSWPSIRHQGLLSTTAVLDTYGISGEERRRIEDEHRPAKVRLEHVTLPRAVIRDQIPMRDSDLKRCLPPNLSPTDWYRLLNQKVFFWLTRERLVRMLKADAYRTEANHVLEIEARALMEAHRDAIWLCPINSGATKPMAHPRGEDSFLRIPNYPYDNWRKKRRKGERVVELAVDYSVPDVSDLVTRVVEMRGDEELAVVYVR